MNEGVDYKGQLVLHFRRGYLTQDRAGFNIWRTESIPRTVPATQTAIIICDMWDKHWSRGAAERVADMAPYMNEVIAVARLRGVQIIHAPSETMDFYQDTLCRHRIRLTPEVPPPDDFERPSPPLPIDDSDHGSDTGKPSRAKFGRASTRRSRSIRNWTSSPTTAGRSTVSCTSKASARC